jgi:hypothetical protein
MQQQELNLPRDLNFEIPHVSQFNSDETERQASVLLGYRDKVEIQKLQQRVLIAILERRSPVYSYSKNWTSERCYIDVAGLNDFVCDTVIRLFQEKGYDISHTPIFGSQMNYEGDILQIKVPGVTFTK